MLREATLKFTRDLSARLLIRSVSDDLIRINEESYSESVALTAEDLLGNWHDTPVADLSGIAPGLDWDRWLGPALWRPYNKRYVQGRWRGHYDFHGGAGLPEWGSHTIDLCQWAADADGTTEDALRWIDDN